MILCCCVVFFCWKVWLYFNEFVNDDLCLSFGFEMGFLFKGIIFGVLLIEFIFVWFMWFILFFFKLFFGKVLVFCVMFVVFKLFLMCVDWGGSIDCELFLELLIVVLSCLIWFLEIFVVVFWYFKFVLFFISFNLFFISFFGLFSFLYFWGLLVVNILFFFRLECGNVCDVVDDDVDLILGMDIEIIGLF